MVDQLNAFAGEVTRVAREVGTEASWRPGAGTRRRRHVEGSHRQCELHGEQPDRSGAQHRGGRHSHRQRRLSRKITVDVRGEILQLKETLNHGGSIEPVRGRVTRVAREVGTEGKLGGQANVPGVAGTWRT